MALRRLLLGGLLVFTIGFAVFALEHMFPPQPYGIADDWRVFYAAATVVQHGGNPYDATTIHAAEQAAQHYQNVQPSLDDFTDLPIIALVLRAVTWLPYWASYAAFSAAGIVIVMASLFAWMRAWGWRRPALWLLGGLASWPVLLGLFSGQFDAVLLGATIAALLLMRRHRPVAAGLCMAAVLLKPHLLWPLPLLLFVVWLDDPRQAWRFAASAAAVILSGTLIGFLLVPNSSGFVGHLLGFGSRVADVQPDLAGVPGMLLHLPGGRTIAVAVAAIGVAAVFALAAWIAVRGRRREMGEHARALIPLAGLAVWLALTPYAHPNDDVLLFPLVVLMVGRDAAALEGRALGAGLVAAAVVAAAFIAAPAIGFLAVIGGASWLVVQRHRVTAPLVAALAFAAVAVLPTVWPFHVLTVPVTPIAVVLTALAGLLSVRETLGPPQPGSVRERVGERERSGGIGGVVVETTPALAAEASGRN
ncbi:MAG: glycosyltransferase family 87 protein [Candidatus Dormibacteria bacterium]